MKTIPEIKSIRKQYKETNYSAIYGVYPKRLSRELGISRNKAKELLDAYWKRNWSVKEVVKKLKTKVVNNKTWVQNPVSGFWHELRFEKDKFSTLNQSTGVYLFDSWVARARVRGVIPSMQFHDEIAVVSWALLALKVYLALGLFFQGA
jgi:hypothetical protein